MTKRCYLSLGSNLGDKKHNILEAVRLLAEKAGTIVKCSSLMVTKPWGFESENDFVNAAVALDTELSAHQLLDTTQEIERMMGRKRKSVGGRYHDRIIDIDILLYGDEENHDERLTIPHPYMNERDFVMLPLKEVYEKKS